MIVDICDRHGGIISLGRSRIIRIEEGGPSGDTVILEEISNPGVLFGVPMACVEPHWEGDINAVQRTVD
jgi:hypothetical protein